MSAVAVCLFIVEWGEGSRPASLMFPVGCIVANQLVIVSSSEWRHRLLIRQVYDIWEFHMETSVAGDTWAVSLKSRKLLLRILFCLLHFSYSCNITTLPHSYVYTNLFNPNILKLVPFRLHIKFTICIHLLKWYNGTSMWQWNSYHTFVIIMLQFNFNTVPSTQTLTITHFYKHKRLEHATHSLSALSASSNKPPQHQLSFSRSIQASHSCFFSSTNNFSWLYLPFPILFLSFNINWTTHPCPYLPFITCNAKQSSLFFHKTNSIDPQNPLSVFLALPFSSVIAS